MLDDLFDDLDHYLAPALDNQPLDDYRVNGLIRAVARRHRTYADAEMVARAEIERIGEWLAEQRSRNDTTGLEQALAGYHAARLDVDPHAKTLRYPAGELTSRAGTARWVFDDDTFVEWAARNHVDLLRETIVTTIDKPAVKKALTVKDDQAVDPESGEVVPGVAIEPGATTFAVKPAATEGF